MDQGGLLLLAIGLYAAVVYGAKLPVAVAMFRLDGRYDNRHPREQQARLEGWGKRAIAAHMNAFEGFPLFAVCVLAVLVRNAASSLAVQVAFGVVLARVVYTGLYIADRASLRSAVWFGTVLGCAALLVLAITR